MTATVTSGASPSVTTTRETPGSAVRPRRSEAAWPDAQSGQTTVSARPNRTRSPISSAWAPSTTTTRSNSATAHWASTAHCSRGRPPRSANSLDSAPNRVPPPAASTSPATSSGALTLRPDLADRALPDGQAATVPAVADGHDLAQDRQGGLQGGPRPQVQPHRAGETRQVVFAQTGSGQSLPPRRLGSARPHRAHKHGRRSQRDLQRRV